MKHLLLAMVCATASGEIVDEAFLAKLRAVESSNGRFVVGDRGRALGPYQIHRGAWDDVNKIRARQGKKTYAWKPYAFQESISKEYCRTYCKWLEAELRGRFRKVDAPMVYACYNAGLENVVTVQGNVNRLNLKTRVKSRKFK